MSKFWKVVSKVGAIVSKSITVEKAQEAITELDINKDGKLSVMDVVFKLIEKADDKA